ncbi:MAG TPA: ABC transporter ATP-binding protein [Candidatus Lachnoclostridium avicola]|nr:ABC transporter ATP-binding protein [Candidatus Lachnoclostridium avicola]
MIETVNLTKRFEDVVAVDHVSAAIKDGYVFGLVGTNGAGKSTFLRMLSGVLKPDEGTVTIDGAPVYENEKAKLRFFYISDDQHFPGNGTPRDMMAFYRKFYPAFDCGRYQKLLDSFGLPGNRKISTFSKGMKKQLSVLCGICAGTDYLFCDETFDGLDPVMRQTVKSLFANDMEERNMTPIIASHNLRELEDICDHVGLLHKGGILLSRDLDEMKTTIHKVQCVLADGDQGESLKGLEIMKKESRGRLLTLTVRGEREQVEAVMQAAEPVFYELIPLSLEEIFISETEVAGYDIKKLVF